MAISYLKLNSLQKALFLQVQVHFTSGHISQLPDLSSEVCIPTS